MNWPAWISAACAALAIAGAVVSWWRENLSRKSKEESERARDEAQRQLAAIERIAEQMQGPEFWMEWVGDTGLMLKTRLNAAVITSLDVPEYSGFGARKDAFPMTITAGIPGRLYYSPTAVSPLETAVGLRIENRPETCHVPLPAPDRR